MQEDRERAYGLGLSRESHIAFASAYIAVLLTIGGYGVARYVAANLPAAQTTPATQTTAAPPARPAHVAFRAHPVPDPAYPPHAMGFYPQVALINHQQGTVVLRLLVLKSGMVGNVSVVKTSGYIQLDAAALVQAGFWRYLPAVRNGQPVEAQVTVAIRFLLKG